MSFKLETTTLIDLKMSGWNLIESDAGLFTSLVEKLQISDVEFEELYSIDEYSLRSLGKLYGVIFLFKYTSQDQSSQPLTGEYLKPEHFQNPQDFNDIFFATQTIQNACATQAVLNTLLNRTDVDIGPELSNFREFVSGFDPVLKGETITNSENIRFIHNSFSSPSRFIDESQQNDNLDESDVYHFVGYVWRDGKVLELDGLKQAPIYHGECDEDGFYAKLSKVLNERISKYDTNQLRFSLLAMVKDLRITLNEINDFDGLKRENQKRLKWERENELRRSDLIGLVHEVTKSLIKQQGEEQWNQTLVDANKVGVKRLTSRISRRFNQ